MKILSISTSLLFVSILSSGLILSQEDTIVVSYDDSESTDYVEEPEPIKAFHGTRIINSHSTENLRKGVLEFRVEHRFGDLAGADGGIQSWFGLDASSDIRLAFEYGVTDKLMLGIGRSKGNGVPYNQLVDGFAKYQVLRQVKDKMPLSLTGLATTSFSYTRKATGPNSGFQYSGYPEFSHRLAYSFQAIAARQFHERFSAALMPTLVHRNYVYANDQNTVLSMGAAARFGLNSKFALMIEYFHTINETGLRTENTNSLGFALEWITFGHNFTIYAVNASGFGETQFITGTTEEWLKGQFRLGFCIGRKFERE